MDEKDQKDNKYNQQEIESTDRENEQALFDTFDESVYDEEEVDQWLTSKELIFMGACIFLGYLMIRAFMNGSGGIWVTLLTIVSCATVFTYAKVTNRQVKKNHYGYLVYSLLLGLSFSFLDNRVFLGLNLIFLLLSMNYWVLVLTGKRRVPYLSQFIISDIIIGTFKRPFQNLGSTFVFKESEQKKDKTIKNIGIGLLISLPIFIVVLLLLSKADSMFEQFLYSFTVTLSENMAERIVAFLFALPIGVYLFLFVYKNSLNEAEDEKRNRKRKGQPIILLTVLVSFILLYLVFFATAILGYFDFRQEPFSSMAVSDYARTGFFQLSLVSLINVTMFLVIKSLSDNQKIITLGLSMIGIETLGLIVLGFAKMQLYISSFGLTILRFNTSCFMIVLFICVCLFIVALWRPFHYIRITIIVVALSILGISFRNTGNDIAAFNIQKYQSGQIEELDIEVFYTIGIEAVPAVVEFYDQTKDSDLKELLNYEYLRPMADQLEKNPATITLQRMQSKKLLKQALHE